MYDTGIPWDMLIFTIIWLITFVVAILAALIADMKKKKAVRFLKGILVGLGLWILFSFVFAFILLNGMGALAGAIGNIAMALIFWTSPTKEEHIKTLQKKLNKKNVNMGELPKSEKEQ